MTDKAKKQIQKNKAVHEKHVAEMHARIKKAKEKNDNKYASDPALAEAKQQSKERDRAIAHHQKPKHSKFWTIQQIAVWAMIIFMILGTVLTAVASLFQNGSL